MIISDHIEKIGSRRALSSLCRSAPQWGAEGRGSGSSRLRHDWWRANSQRGEQDQHQSEPMRGIFPPCPARPSMGYPSLQPAQAVYGAGRGCNSRRRKSFRISLNCGSRTRATSAASARSCCGSSGVGAGGTVVDSRYEVDSGSGERAS